MRKKRLSSVFESVSRFVKNRKATKSEIEEFQKWIISDEEAKEKNEALFKYWKLLSNKPDASVYRSLSIVKSKLNMQQQSVVTKKGIPLRTILLRAAVIVLPLLVVGAYYYYDSGKEVNPNSIPVEISVSRASERKQTVLSDGTDLWVNAGSKVVFQERSEKGERIAKLSGEAYFDVEKQEDAPFVVETKYLSVRVLGTRFNVEAYGEDENTIVTLEYGIIEVKTKAGMEYILEPGQQLIYHNQTKEVAIKQIEIEATDHVSAWKENNLSMKSKTLNEILQTLSQAYNVRFIVDDKLLESDEIFFVNFTRDESLELVMEVLSSMVGGFNYAINENEISIYI